MERHDFRTKRTDDLVSLANTSTTNLRISGLLSLVRNAQFEKPKLPTVITQYGAVCWFATSIRQQFAVAGKGIRKKAEVLM